MESSAHMLGLVGVLIILTTYLALQLEKLKVDGITYSLANIVGSVFLLFSLYYTWNTASVMIEIAWLVISLFGLLRAWSKRARKR